MYNLLHCQLRTIVNRRIFLHFHYIEERFRGKPGITEFFVAINHVIKYLEAEFTKGQKIYIINVL